MIDVRIHASRLLEAIATEDKHSRRSKEDADAVRVAAESDPIFSSIQEQETSNRGGRATINGKSGAGDEAPASNHSCTE